MYYILRKAKKRKQDIVTGSRATLKFEAWFDVWCVGGIVNGKNKEKSL